MSVTPLRPPQRPEPPRGAGRLQMPAAFDEVIGYHLRLAQEASFQAVSQGAGSSNLKPGWYTLLTILAENPGLTPSELSLLCGRDRSTLTATLRALDEQGLIDRKRRSEDQRSYGVRLTPAGDAMLGELRIIAQAHDARLDAIVGRDKAVFLAVLRRLVEQLGADELDGAGNEKRVAG